MYVFVEADAAARAFFRRNQESSMSDHKPSEPKPSDFKEAAERSQDANIADESAAYQNAAQPTEEGAEEQEGESHPS
jgi:hypothetical protein